MTPFFFFFFILFVSGIFFYFWFCFLKQGDYLAKISQGMPGQFQETFSFWQQLTHLRGRYSLKGQISQRPLTLLYFYAWRRLWEVQSEPAPDERLELQFPLIQKFWLRMILEPAHEERKEEVVLGNPTLDSLYVIHSNQPEVAREFLTSQAALQDLQRLPFPFDRLEIHKGLGRVVFAFPARRHFDRMHLQIAVEALARIFSDYETRSTLVIVISVSPDTRCPYCRETLSAAAGPVIQCIQCNAKLHQSCWDENRQCTTWGCQSTTVSKLELES